MRIVLDQQRLNRDAERAQVARWFGDSDIGPVFFAAADRPIPVSADERDRWLAQANRLVDRHVAQQRWVGFQAIAIAVVAMLTFIALIELFARFVPRIATIPPVIAAIVGLVWPLAHAMLHRRQLAALRRDIGDRLWMRTPLAAALVPYGRRHNLFRAASLAVMLAGIGWVVLAAIRGQQGDGMTTVIVLWPIALVLHLAGRRVDDVQRRRHDPAI